VRWVSELRRGSGELVLRAGGWDEHEVSPTCTAIKSEKIGGNSHLVCHIVAMLCKRKLCSAPEKIDLTRAWRWKMWQRSLRLYVSECVCVQRRQHCPRRQVFLRSRCAVPACTSASLRQNVQRCADVACSRSRRVVDRAWSTRWSTHREVIIHVLVKRHNPVFYPKL
jgi:hypothetical protein